ncbi:MAG: NAD(P)/FAD-dependent oxidoreductase [Firmicutes bacterium]|nr:NAD(P)/FAD-dependent oxidoreductase [Bacillota bacterium]
MKNIAVIGGGPAGMIAAGFAAKRGNKVTLFEKNEKIGKKLYITGKGRCNLTNASDPSEVLENVLSNPEFLYSALYGFTSFDTMALFEELGVELKVERGNRVFPKSDKSADILDALKKFMRQAGVKLCLNSKVSGVITEQGIVKGVKVKGDIYPCDSVIIATGGLSYPSTGSTGDGYTFAKSAGHSVTELYPSLVPLVTKEKWVSSLQGLTLKNIDITFKQKNKDIYSKFGELLFTHFGISGPVVLSGSRFVTGKKDITAYIDMKPALDEKQLDERILRDFEKFKNKDIVNALEELLPKRMISPILKLSNIDERKKVNSITKQERNEILKNIKSLKLTIEKTADFNQAVITMGGVNVREIDPSTMESKKVKGLYFAGEVMDIDAFTGGFNLQLAFSTGYIAGNNA